jgi:polyisoprenoid-binding protein YceI
VASPVAASGFRIVLDDASEARFRAQEVLARLRTPSEALGKTSRVTGAVVFDAAGKIVPAESKITVDVSQLQSDQALRDRYIKSETLETSRFPTAVFEATEARGLPWPPPASGEVRFQLLGNLTVHGVTRPATWDVVADVNGNQIHATATTRVKITDFGMQIPQVASVLSLEDELTLEVETTATRA